MTISYESNAGFLNHSVSEN